MKSDVKRKLITGTIETLLGIAVLICSWIKDIPLLYMGLLLVGSGLLTLIICGLRIIADKNEEKTQTGKHSIRKTIQNTVSMLLVIAVVAAAGILLYKFVIKGNDGFPPDSNLPTVIQLDTPQQVSFDSESYVLSWGAVENAASYTVYYNGTEISVDNGDTRKQITLIAQDNIFKVKAVGDGANYSDSKWSQEVTYTIDNRQEELSVFEKVNLKLAEAAQSKGLKLESIIGISDINLETNIYENHIEFETLCSKKGVLKNYCFGFKNEGYTSSIEELLIHFDMATLNDYYDRKTVDYNSAEFLTARGDEKYNNEVFDGKMEELRLQGYTISVISSVTREGKKVGGGINGERFQFEILGTYKAEKDGDVKYFTSVNRITTDILSVSDEYNYLTCLPLDEHSTVKEYSFIEHETGATWLYMEEWVAKNNLNSAS